MSDDQIHTEDATTSASTTETSSAWYLEEGRPGEGARPDWMPDKFRTVADIAKSYRELESRIGSAPESYSLEVANAWIDEDFGPIQDMLAYAKTKGISQEIMDKVFDSVGKYLDEFTPDYEAERAALGEKADERLEVLDTWAKSNFSKETYEALTNNLKTADAIKAIEEVRIKMNNNATTIPNSTQQMNAQAPSLADIQSEMNRNLDKYKTDPVYRREMQAKMELASKNSGFEAKQAY